MIKVSPQIIMMAALISLAGFREYANCTGPECALDLISLIGVGLLTLYLGFLNASIKAER